MPPVRIDRNGRVIDRVTKVRKPRNDDVLWIAQDNGGPWTITFDKTGDATGTYPVEPGSPFSQDTYRIERGASGGSAGGPVNGVAGRTYRYQVRDEKKTVTDDPDVDVES